MGVAKAPCSLARSCRIGCTPGSPSPRPTLHRAADDGHGDRTPGPGPPSPVRGPGEAHRAAGVSETGDSRSRRCRPSPTNPPCPSNLVLEPASGRCDEAAGRGWPPPHRHGGSRPDRPDRRPQPAHPRSSARPGPVGEPGQADLAPLIDPATHQSVGMVPPVERFKLAGATVTSPMSTTSRSRRARASGSSGGRACRLRVRHDGRGPGVVGPVGRPLQQHAAPAVIIKAGHRRQLGAVGQVDPPDDVHLPQLHRPRPLPPRVIRPPTLPLRRVDQAVTNQRPIRRRPTRHRIHTIPTQLVHDRPRPPTTMGPAQLHDPRLHRRRRLMRTPPRPRGPVRQPGRAPRRVSPQPVVHRLTGHAATASHIHRRGPVQHLTHRLVPLLHQPQLHEHGRPPPGLQARTTTAKKVATEPLDEPQSDHECRAGTGATVSSIYRRRTRSTG